jgi:hypothetical protein
MEVNMFRAILSGLKGAFGYVMAGAWSLCNFVLCLPARMLGIGATPMPMPSFKLPAPPLPSLAAITPAEIAESISRESHQAYSFAACCVLDGRKPEMPSTMSRRLQAWLPGLRYEELEKLAEARPAGILAHLRGEIIAGVRCVQPLPPADLVVPPEELQFIAADREYDHVLGCAA